MNILKKILYCYGIYTACGRIYHFLHSKPNSEQVEKIAALFTTPGSDKEAKFMGMFGFHREEEEDENEVTNKIGF